jgi:predicted dienelactone hydrolase
MRPVETLLLIVNSLTFLLLAAPRIQAGRPRFLAAVAAAIVGAQALVEGPRWQMIPAYALSGVCLLVSLPLCRELPGPHARLAGAALGAVWLASSAGVPMLVPVFGFPQPTGPYAIGTLTYHWVDEARPDVFSTNPNDRRELMVQIWYPASVGDSSQHAAWVQDADALAPELGRLFGVPGFMFGHFKYITTNAVQSAPISDAAPSYPVLIFLEGLEGFRQHNTFQVEELVSHGYIVAAIDQPHTAAMVALPDGRQVAGLSRDQTQPLIDRSLIPTAPVPILAGRPLDDGIVPYLAQDVSFALDQLAALNRDRDDILDDRLDLQRVGVFGVSLGGIVAGEACRLDPRVRACLVMDAPMTDDVVQAGLHQPTMWITRDAATMRLEGWPRADIDQHQTSMRRVFDSLPGDGYFVQIPGLFHLNLTDFPLVSPLTSWLGVTGPIDAQRAHRIVNAYSLAFFDHQLRSLPEALLDEPSLDYPEVLLETRR